MPREKILSKLAEFHRLWNGLIWLPVAVAWFLIGNVILNWLITNFDQSHGLAINFLSVVFYLPVKALAVEALACLLMYLNHRDYLMVIFGTNTKEGCNTITYRNTALNVYYVYLVVCGLLAAFV